MQPRLCSVTLQPKLHGDINSRTTDEIVKTLEDQVQDKGAIVLVIPQKSCIWKDPVVKALMMNWSLGYVNIDMTRIITNIKSIAEQLKSAKIKSNATDATQNPKKTVMDETGIEQRKHKTIVKIGSQSTQKVAMVRQICKIWESCET